MLFDMEECRPDKNRAHFYKIEGINSYLLFATVQENYFRKYQVNF